MKCNIFLQKSIKWPEKWKLLRDERISRMWWILIHGTGNNKLWLAAILFRCLISFNFFPSGIFCCQKKKKNPVPFVFLLALLSSAIIYKLISLFFSSTNTTESSSFDFIAKHRKTNSFNCKIIKKRLSNKRTRCTWNFFFFFWRNKGNLFLWIGAEGVDGRDFGLVSSWNLLRGNLTQ